MRSQVLKALVGALLLAVAAPSIAAVGFDTNATGGNGTSGQSEYGTTTPFTSSTFITVGASATLLVVDVSTYSSASTFTGQGCTWNGVSMVQAAQEINGELASTIYVLVNPAAGAQALSCSFYVATGATAWYVNAASFTGTDTTTGYKSIDSVATTASPVTINTSTNDATLAIFGCVAGGNPAPTNFTTLFTNTNNTQNGAASYTLGGTGTNAHTFSCSGGTEAGAGVHIIAPGAAPSNHPPLFVISPN